MGQAKTRGTFEERKAAAIIRQDIEEKERKKLDHEHKLEHERSLTPEQKRKGITPL